MTTRPTLIVATVVAAAGMATAFVAPVAAAPAPSTEAWGTTASAPADGLVTLKGVGAAAADDVVAVGVRRPDPEVVYRDVPYAEHWNGTAWTATAVPSAAAGEPTTGALAAAAAVRPGDAWAVGTLADPNSLQGRTYAIHWDGTAWTRAETPDPGGPRYENSFADVAAGPDGEVWAVGRYGATDPTGAYGQHSLVAHLDGTVWRRVAVPDIGPLLAVAVDPAGGVFVAGRENTVLQRVGAGWRQLPPASDQFGDVPRISGLAVSGGRLWAAGLRVLFDDTLDYSYAAFWDGHRWTAADIPSGDGTLDIAPGPDGGAVVTLGRGAARLTAATATIAVTPVQGVSSLVAVSTDPAGRAWAVGSGRNAGDPPAIVTAPGIGQGGIVVQTHHYNAVVTWTGPVRFSAGAGQDGVMRAGGLPVGRYVVTVAVPDCVPAQRSVQLRAGVAVGLDLPPVC